MTDDLDQLLSNLHLARIREIFDRELKRADQSTPSYEQFEYEEWYEFLGQKKAVEALLDRLRHHCHTVRIDGPSLREPQHPG